MLNIEIPAYSELSIKNLYTNLKDQYLLKRYLPDYSKNSLPDKQFFYPVISTLFPKEVGDLVKEARKKRSIMQPSNNDELVAVSSEIKKEIESLLLHPSKFKHI